MALVVCSVGESARQQPGRLTSGAAINTSQEVPALFHKKRRRRGGPEESERDPEEQFIDKKCRKKNARISHEHTNEGASLGCCLQVGGSGVDGLLPTSRRRSMLLVAIVAWW